MEKTSPIPLRTEGKTTEKSNHESLETFGRSLWKAVTYRVGSMLTVGPATAVFIYHWTTGHWSFEPAMKQFGAASIIAGGLFNTTYYLLSERAVYTRIHNGYVFLREKAEHSKGVEKLSGLKRDIE